MKSKVRYFLSGARANRAQYFISLDAAIATAHRLGEGTHVIEETLSQKDLGVVVKETVSIRKPFEVGKSYQAGDWPDKWRYIGLSVTPGNYIFQKENRPPMIFESKGTTLTRETEVIERLFVKPVDL